MAHLVNGLYESSETFRMARRQLDAVAGAVDLHPDLLARVLAGRGVTAQTCETFLNPTIRALMPDPNTLVGMEALAARLAQSIMKAEKIAIFGALSLYLDFVNLFQFLMSFIGQERE